MNISKKIKDFSKNISGKLHTEYELKKMNWFGIGGPAKIYFQPNSLKELSLFLKEFGDYTSIKIIGAGSNLLIRDGGYDGIIIKLGKKFSHISKINDKTLVSGTSILDKKLSQFAMENEISGFEFLSCIPGSVGGAIRMNSGCYDYNISQSLLSLQAINKSGLVRLINSKQINFNYRGSDIEKDLIFLSATLVGKKEKKENIIKKMEILISKKKKSQPSQIKTCGSTFKNPIDQTKKKSWELIKESGCESLTFGGASLSPHHVNFFVNNGNATASDMENLIDNVKKKVFSSTGIKLELELEVIGKKI
tara:strand:+ start:6077 stop:6997 length:921 start_codon:yes stop_codon:yes gene_type:complete